MDITVDYYVAPPALTAAEVSAANAAASAEAAASSAAAASISNDTCSTNATNAANSAAAAAASAGIAVAAAGFQFVFDNQTTMADPGAGVVRFNNATIASVTAIAIDDLSADTGNPDVSPWVLTFDDSTNTAKGLLRFRKVGDAAVYVDFTVTGLTDNAGWMQLSVIHVGSSGSIADGDALVSNFSRSGDKGADGGGGGDVVGPSSATDGNVATFNGTTGKLIRDGGFAVSAFMQSVLGESTAIDVKSTLGIDIVNAADYVVGDGVTDDTSAFASALTAAHGKTLYVPSGITVLTGNITLANSSPTNIPTRIVAHGATFKAKSGLSTTSYLLKLENVHGASPAFRWEGGTFNCDAKCRGVYIHGMQRCYVGHIRVINSYGQGVDVVGEAGYGVYYNIFEGWRIGESGSQNGSTGVNDYANGAAYYNGANTYYGCVIQYNKGHGFYVDYSQNNYISCSVEKNDLYGYNLITTHATTIIGGYSERNHENWATDGASDGSTDYSLNCTAATTGVKLYGGRHAAVNGTLTGGGNVFDIAYPGTQGMRFDGTTFSVNGQYAFPATQNASSNANTLDDYEEGSWTPAITFGGGATGMTFSDQEGTYTKIGRHVFCRGSIQMSSKGTSTGVARMTGLPFAAASSKTSSVVLDYYSGMSSFTAGVAEVNGGAASANFYIPGASASASATDANFTNTSAMWFSFHYHV